MRFFKNLNGKYIDSISTGSGEVEFTESEYNEIHNIILNRPTPPNGYDYMLRADTLEWELVELPPMPEDEDIPDEEALDIILGVSE